MADRSVTLAVPLDAHASSGTAAPVPRRRARQRLVGHLYVLPAAAVYVYFAIWPTLTTVGLSFTHWDGISPATWAGTDNYTRVFTDHSLINAVLHSLVLILFFTVIPVVLGLFITALLTQRVRTGMSFFRIVFFLPQVLPLVAVGITWRWLYSERGVINQALVGIGLGDITRAWLGDYDLALIALGLIGTWTMSGLCMVLFLSGVQKIDPQYYEAATLDGAGAYRQFISVTLPELRTEVTIAAVITTIAALASFDLVFVTTNGGPANQTAVPGLLVYRLAFNEGNIGGASALAVTLSVIVIGIVTLIRFLAREKS